MAFGPHAQRGDCRFGAGLAETTASNPSECYVVECLGKYRRSA